MATVKIHCQGDSIMEGYPLSAGEDMPSYLQVLLTARADGNTYTVSNTGYRNRTMVQIDANYAAYVGDGYDGAADKNTLILWAGGNDIYFLAGKQAATIAAFDSVVTKARATGYDEIIVMNIIQRGANASGTIETWRAEAQAINDHFAVQAAALNYVTLFDVKALYPSYDWEVYPFVNPEVPAPYNDWAHPTAASHSAEAVVIEPIINLSIPVTYAGTITLYDGTRYLIPYYDDYVLGDPGLVLSNVVGHYRVGMVDSGGMAVVDNGVVRKQLEIM